MTKIIELNVKCKMSEPPRAKSLKSKFFEFEYD